MFNDLYIAKFMQSYIKTYMFQIFRTIEIRNNAIICAYPTFTFIENDHTIGLYYANTHHVLILLLFHSVFSL